MIDALLLGNLSIDHNFTESGLYVGCGGSVYFCAKTFENLDVAPSVISSYGKDFSKKCLPKTIFYPFRADLEKTLVFKNLLQANGKRIQKVKNYQESWGQSKGIFIDRLMTSTPIVIIAPILNNIDTNIIKKILYKFNNSLTLLLPQGFYRTISDSGDVIPQPWIGSEEITSLFKIIVVSEKDWQGVENDALKWSRFGSEVIVTRAEKGCSFYTKKGKENMPGFLVDQVRDSTGAGDVFAASFAYQYLKGNDIIYSATFANAAAAISLRFMPDELKYTYQDIVNFIKKGRQIKL